MLLSKNYSLKKPEYKDPIDIDDINYNTDKIDAQMKEMANKVDNIKLDAENVNVKDPSNVFTANKVEGVLKELYDKANSATNKANEAFQCASNGKGAIAGKLGGGCSSNNTHQQLADHIQWCKNDLANLIASKGVGANAGSGLHDLLSLVGNIPCSKTVRGTSNHYERDNCWYIDINPGFEYKFIIGTINYYFKEDNYYYFFAFDTHIADRQYSNSERYWSYGTECGRGPRRLSSCNESNKIMIYTGGYHKEHPYGSTVNWIAYTW